MSSSANILMINQSVNDAFLCFKFLFEDEAFKSDLLAICNVCVSIYRKGGKVIVAGNGGSAADAQHFAGELVSKFNFDRPALPAVALTTDSSVITAIGNDYGFEKIFSRQIQALGCPDDLFLAISTSGNSENIIHAVIEAKKMGLVTVGLTGLTGGELKKNVDYCICAPSNSTPRIQECHLFIEHLICGYIESVLFGVSSK